jgi:hypothetical protein
MTDPTELNEAEIARVALAMAKADGWDGSVGGTLLPFDILPGPMLTSRWQGYLTAARRHIAADKALWAMRHRTTRTPPASS